jgi:pimeloyl-ACP methyl ester carboxylesterase
MNPIGTITHRPARPRLGLALLTTALLAATACGTDSRSESASVPTTTSVAPPATTSVAPPTTTVPPIARPTAMIDHLVEGRGARVHVRCVGHGDATVLLISGFGGDTTSWVGVEPALAASARVCSYDRAGTGTSDPATSTATFATQAHDLHALLNSIGEPGPYVAVGHSFGGAQAVTFASLFADEVSGLVLVDASPTTWPADLCAVPDDGSEAAAMVVGNCTGAFLPAGNGEHLDVAAAFDEVSRIVSLDSLPIAVISATERELPVGLAATEVARLTEAWNKGQRDWRALSANARLVSVEDTSHHIQIDRPDVVIDEIARLLP